MLETLTYSCINLSDLNELTVKVEELINSIRKKIPRHELQPKARKTMRKRAQKICRKYRSLPYSVKRGHLKNDWHYKGHVGTKATDLRKVYVYSVT